VAALSLGVLLALGFCLWSPRNAVISKPPAATSSSSPHQMATAVMLFTNPLAGVGQSPSFILVTNAATPLLAAGHHPFPSGLAPGVYAARPYSMIVVVPPDVDSGIACGAPDNAQFNMHSIDNMPCLEPQIHLEKISPH
jgi:hypothetical protein